VQLPPGYETKWHSHEHDGVFVNIEPSETRAQDLGGQPAVRPPRLIGETSFSGYAEQPKTHKVANMGATTYRVTDSEILAPCGAFATVQDGEGQTLILENQRVRVTRLMIAPGERLPLHPTCGMLVAVTAGRLKFLAPGGEEEVTLGPAGFKWRDQRTPLTFVNTGSEVFHGVDIVVK
jgi:quercetin dioxygenase-like cupin family protein